MAVILTPPPGAAPVTTVAPAAADGAGVGDISVCGGKADAMRAAWATAVAAGSVSGEVRAAAGAPDPDVVAAPVGGTLLSVAAVSGTPAPSAVRASEGSVADVSTGALTRYVRN